ncbi:Putative metallo-hydrolase YycJ [Limihaloglobus sulfuriphilus]|uniref:Putative metallo-hydrolase YycJ n=1 Tax=Limihaloglobus sulfuriphilus TaxID=1851148 RepID=A0A1Q2MC80_9BACT|nr:MBL fold metallo-hydrolase [Limihaloglobus sulfuriphilus]AQQ70291.1 Putative metallo-hydrolase YycJ [Limihaloglobus sulfuriphilus]
MSLYFQSILSSSSGNCLALWSETTRLLIDCGFSSMKKTREAITGVYGDPYNAHAVLVTHMHGDHISYYPLRALENCGIPVHVHSDCIEQLKTRHFREYGFANLVISPFEFKSFEVGDFQVTPFEVAHNPAFRTCGFIIRHGDKKIVVATDFNEWQSIFGHFIDADFIFVESNHDLELLRKYYNPNSIYHLPNPSAAEFLLNLSIHNKKQPDKIMFGHLSSQRNRCDIALRETCMTFDSAGRKMDFELVAAPLRFPGDVISI